MKILTMLGDICPHQKTAGEGPGKVVDHLQLHAVHISLMMTAHKAIKNLGNRKIDAIICKI